MVNPLVAVPKNPFLALVEEGVFFEHVRCNPKGLAGWIKQGCGIQNGG